MNKKGFSLIELMVVVGIIAVLGMVAIPAYNNYQARSRRAEGMNLLSAYFSSAIGVKAEFGRFPGNFVQTDFAPVGNLLYRIQVADGNDINIPLVDNACINTANGTACNCGGACAGFKTWAEAVPPSTMGAIGGSFGPIAIGAGGGVCGPVAALGTTDNTFSARAASVINLKATVRDVIGIDEQKQTWVCLDGS